ncbi:MAG: ATP-binding protein, partial [Gammaproteobacteria bacterium]|nr:ATP-binding protein [Gammaproteobacteria bacterium]
SLSALFSLLLGTYLTRQLRHLANASRQVAKGEFNVTVPVAGKDELATTSLAFNRMSEELGKLYRNLETKVQERATQFNRSEVRARTILMNIGEGLITTDKLGKIISYNRAAVQMFGWPETGMEEKLIDPYISITDIDSVSQSAMDLQSEKTGSHRNQVVAKNESGKPFFIELLSTWLLLDEKLTRIVLVEDITERLKSAESLKMAQESLVESAHKAGMAEFSTGVLHNIGNLLNSVALSGERMQTALDDNLHHGVKKLRNFLEDEAQDVTVAIKNAEKGSLFIDYIKRLEEEISQERDEIGQELSALKQKLSMMKDIIRTQQNYMRVASFIENFAMIELLEDCVKIEGESLHSRGIILSVECDKHLRVSAVRSKVLQILTNIIKNAKDAVAANKYLNKNSVIHIVCSKQDDGNATIRITDNGVGIEKENLEAIFQYGYSDKENGHGFGLNVSVMTAREMGGNIIAYSEGPGRGATFVLTLPLSDAAGDKKVS